MAVRSVDNGVVTKRLTISFPANGTGLCLCTSGFHPFVAGGIACCFATHGTGFGRGTGGVYPLMAERVPFGISAYTTGFGRGAGGLLPFVIVERYCTARTEKDAEQNEIENVTKEF